ncbi:MAG TPA: BPTI/Kunitz domain-containing protein [Polyangiaceae bacterium]|nr:BPTI/Kunitz domain-containing protein [Polyangiaceae bacterium]
MTQLSSLVRVVGGACAVVLLASACGGKSFVGNGADDGDGDEGGSVAHGGSSGQAGSAKGGNATAGTASAGRASTGGTGTGIAGSVGTGGGVGTAGSVGMAGAANTACTAPNDPGQCDAYQETWYNDPVSGICRPSYYGGCGGNANRYPTLADCQKACPGGNPNYDSCSRPSDCVVAGTGCCGVCESPSLTVHDFIAYNHQYEPLSCSVLKAAPAPGNIAPPGTALPCAPCANTGNATLRNFVPDCVAGQCVVVDIRQSPTTACTDSSQCRLRSGTGCCEACDGGDLIAVRDDGSFEDLVCGGVLPPCCAPLPPSSDASVTCANGRCAVAYSSTTR